MSCPAFRRNVGAGLAPPVYTGFDRAPSRAVGAGFYPARAGCTNKFAQRTATLHDDRRGDAHSDPAACNRKIAKPICDPAQRFVGADDPVRPAGCTCKNEYTPVNPFTVCRGRYPHRPARRTRKIAPIMINCKNPNSFVGEGFYPSWRYNAANWDVPMRNGTCCVVAIRHANLLMHRAWEGQSPSPAACRAILRFYDTRWQVCRCTTGGQRRPPLQNVVRFRPDACNFAIAYRRVDVGIDPYKRFTASRWCVCICGCMLLRGQRRPPLRVHSFPHWCMRICDIVPPRGASPSPTLRRNTKCASKPQKWQRKTALLLQRGFCVGTTYFPGQSPDKYLRRK